jgi:hypothetical protein
VIAAFQSLEVSWQAGTRTAGLAGDEGTHIDRVEGAIQFVLAYLADGAEAPAEQRLLLVMGHITGMSLYGVGRLRQALGVATGVPPENVYLFSSHNHCAPELERAKAAVWRHGDDSVPDNVFTEKGQAFLEHAEEVARTLPDQAVPVGVRWAVGREATITYNRKAYRADGSSYFMREEDRKLVGADYSGDIDPDAPILLFENEAGRPVGGLCQFTGHPVTAYHPERFVVFGEWPAVATEIVGGVFNEVPVGFLQGTAGDINSKEFLSGRIDVAREYGRRLGASYLTALAGAHRQAPAETRFAVAAGTAAVPFAPLPSEEHLLRELDEIDAFIARAEAGREDTRECVGLNFPQVLSPAYRGLLVKAVRPWTAWALQTVRSGTAVPKALTMPVVAFRIGETVWTGFPCEAFSAIGRTVKRRSPFPLTVPCGYMNASYGYVPNAGNVGGNEYMSSFYRYTRYWPPYARPGGDVLAEEALRLIRQLRDLR